MSLPEFRPGDTVAPGRTILDVSDTADMEITSRVNEQERTTLVVGQAATVRADALPGVTLAARITALSGVAIRSREQAGPLRQFEAILRLDAPDPRLRPGTTVRVTIAGKETGNVLTVPRQAVFQQEGRPIVYLRTFDGFEPRAVTVIGQSESRTAIEGIEEGEEIARVSPAAAARSDARTPAAAPAAAPVPEPEPQPEYRDLTIPAGTSLSIVLDTEVASATSKLEDAIRGHLGRTVTVEGLAALPKGTRLSGVVTEAKPSGKVKGLASVAFRFTDVRVGEEVQRIHTSAVSRQAKATKGKDATKIGVGAGAGALIGAIAGGGKGAAIGAGVGGAAGTGVVMATKGEEVTVPAGTTVTASLTEPLTVRVLVTK
jgi:hypothetical protein